MGKKLYNKEWVIAGLALFVIICVFPILYNLGRAAPQPKPELTEKARAAKTCVRETDYMRTEHMQLLDLWRDEVVRNANRVYVYKGKEYNMSLSNTCMDCHSNKAEFCDKCHAYASVDPYCWDCHIENPRENPEAEGEE